MQLIVAEFYKSFSTRLWMWMLLAAIGIAGLYASLNIAFSADPRTLTLPLSTAAGQRTLFAVASGAAAPLAAVLAAVGISGEFRHRTVSATFLATPRRGRVIAAKFVTYGLLGAAFGILSTAAVTAIALPWLAVKGVDVSLVGNGIPGTITANIASVAVYAIIGVGLGALLRDQVATVAGLLIYLYVVEPIVTRIPSWYDWTVYLPGPANSALTGITLTNQEFLSPWQGGLVLLGYGLVAALAGTYVTVGRDVT